VEILITGAAGFIGSHLVDRFLAEDGVILTAAEKSALADIILRAAVGYGPLDSLLHDRSFSEIMVNGHANVYIERRGRVPLASPPDRRHPPHRGSRSIRPSIPFRASGRTCLHNGERPIIGG